jgi:hypothetical protein
MSGHEVTGVTKPSATTSATNVEQKGREFASLLSSAIMELNRGEFPEQCKPDESAQFHHDESDRFPYL